MNYQKIDKFSIADGLGVRVVLWVNGCTQKCKGCHNSQLWDFDGGTPFGERAKEELLDALSKPYIRGLTISGGHPLEEENVTEVLKIVKLVKSLYPDKDIWLYTGYEFEELAMCVCKEKIYCLFDKVSPYSAISELLCYIDILVDGRYMEDQRDITLPFRGSKNQRIIDLKSSAEKDELVELIIE